MAFCCRCPVPGASRCRQALSAGWPLCPTSLLPIFPLLALFCRSPGWWGPSSMDLTLAPPNTPSPSCTLSPPQGPAPGSHISPFFWLARPTYTSRYSNVFLHTHTIPFVAKFMGESSLQRNPLWPPLNSAGSPVEVVPQLFPRFGSNCPKPGQKLSSHWAEGHI